MRSSGALAYIDLVEIDSEGVSLIETSLDIIPRRIGITMPDVNVEAVGDRSSPHNLAAKIACR